MKSSSDVKPKVFQDLGDGSWHYNFNIREVDLPVEEEGQPAKKGFEYETVHIWGTPNYDICVKAVLRDRRDETEEFKLINKYNSYALGLSTEETYKKGYEAYLQEVLDVKAMVKVDIAGAGF